MSKEQRKHQRNPSHKNLRILTSITGVAYTVSLRDISKSGAFIHTIHLPTLGETISFEILDEYGLRMAMGHGKVVRLTGDALETAMGFAIVFDEELDLAMLDYLSSVRIEETA